MIARSQHVVQGGVFHVARTVPHGGKEMTIKKTEVLIVGAGQAGIVLSQQLTKAEAPHIVIERERIAERWRTERWETLVANGQAWHDRFPNMKITNDADDEFSNKDQMAAYF